MNETKMSYQPLREVARKTTIIESPRLSKLLGVDLTIASETFQHTGSFKFRAAYNVAANVDQKEIIAASSGNFGQALAYSCLLLGKRCTVVMPETSARVKIDAVREYGATADLINVKEKGREERVSELVQANPQAYRASAYDDPLVIEGNASLGEELAQYKKAFDFVISPIGGGGLSSGIIKGLRRAGSDARVFAAEPLMANDAARSMREGRVVRNETEPQTIADGARTVSVGNHNWEILGQGLAGVIEIPEEKIKEAVKLYFSLVNLKAEPTGALSLAAILVQPETFRSRAVCCVVSGGNVDADVYKRILSED
jgi:threonine dehydratase